MQTTNKVFMVRPIAFNYNEQTAINNKFQTKSNISNINDLATKEFDNYVQLLKENGVQVIVVNDTLNPHTPDSIFPNNWFSTHSEGKLVYYSMFAPNRRSERKSSFIAEIKKHVKADIEIDFTPFETENIFLEGTGSMVLDRDNKIVYACNSIRTSKVLIDEFCKEFDYKACLFDASGKDDVPIYHTNVLMCVGVDFAIVCLDAIKDEKQKADLVKSLNDTNKHIIPITYDQLEHFAGNMLELRNNKDQRLLVMSKTAHDSLTSEQIKILESKCKLIAPDITTIETNGGGSARCMLAELFN